MSIFTDFLSYERLRPESDPEQVALRSAIVRRKIEGGVSLESGRRSYGFMIKAHRGVRDTVKRRVKSWAKQHDFVPHVQSVVPSDIKDVVTQSVDSSRLDLQAVLDADAHNEYFRKVIEGTAESVQTGSAGEIDLSASAKAEEIAEIQRLVDSLSATPVHAEFTGEGETPLTMV